jgi:hypothetical protein
MPIVHITETCGAAVVQLQAHVHVMAFPATQDAAVPFGTLVIYMVGAILLTLATVKPPLALAPPAIDCILIVPLLGYASDGGIVDEGGTDSTMITPCCSSSVAVAGTVVVMSLVTSPNGMINMATIVCGGMCTGGGGSVTVRSPCRRSAAVEKHGILEVHYVELQSHSLQQVELEIVSGTIASRGASEILR